MPSAGSEIASGGSPGGGLERIKSEHLDPIAIIISQGVRIALIFCVAGTKVYW